MTDQTAASCPHARSYPFVRDVAQPFDPAPEATLLRHDEPISRVRLWNGQEPWLITGLADVRAVLSDGRFSSVPHHENYPTLSPGHLVSKTQDASFLRKDKPEHTRERRLWQPFFGAGNIAAMKPRIQTFIDESLDAMIAQGQPADLYHHLALEVPSRVISHLLGVPDEDHEFFQDHSAVMLDTSHTHEETRAAGMALKGYWETMVAQRMENPGDDLVSRLIVSEVLTGNLKPSDVVAMANLILFAGHGTTADMIALGALTLLQHPETISAMRENPAMTPRVVEELLRYITITHNGLQRVALEDIEVGGKLIRAGEGVICHLASANRDEAAFDQPDAFKDDRQIRLHVAFGAGIHACIGAPLARLELQMVFDTLFARLPTLRLAEPLSALEFRGSGLFYGVDRVPVAW